MKLLRTYAFLLTLLILVSPGFADEHATEETPTPVKKYAEFTLGGTYTDTKTVSTFGTASTKTLRGLFRKLDALKTDDDIAGVIFRIEGVGVGWATLQEIRTKLHEFRDAGKETIGYLEGGGNAEYLLASVMDRVVLTPTGGLNLTGLRAEVLFYKGLFDKLDIEADMLAMGEYKSGIEPYMRDGMSDAFRESMTALLDDLYAQLLNHIAENRDGISAETASDLIDRGPFTAAEAKQEKLVDALQYYDELVATLKAASEDEEVQVGKPGAQRERKVPDMNSFAGLMQLFSMLNPPQRAQAAGENQIALIYASGPILPDIDSLFIPMAVVTPKALKKAFEKARTDDSVRAVVFRIDSPGGSAFASDLIWREVVLTQREKPVVVSMGDVAASGGYYIAMAAGTIVAHPSTLTGSIGVFGGKLNLKGLYDKAGLTKEIIAHGQNATLYSDYGGFTPTERERVEKMMKTVYEDFVSKAAAGRGKSFDAIDEIAQGRVWTGRQAQELGLVDELGGLDVALSIAKEQAGFAEDDKVNLIVLPKQRPLFEQLIEQMIEGTAGSSIQPPRRLAASQPVLSMLGKQSQHLLAWLSLFGFKDGTQIVTILPYDISIR